MTISIDMMTDYLFENPEVSNLVLFQYFGKTRHNTKTDIRESEFISEIARSTNLCQSNKECYAGGLDEGAGHDECHL